eukprot:gene29253-38323_t
MSYSFCSVRFICLTFFIKACVVNCFSFPLSLGDVPTLEPLRYVTPDVIGIYAVSSIENALWSTLLPADRQDAIAIFIAEGVSGFIGGVAAKGIAIIDGNKNSRESSFLSAELSGAYFGVAGALRSLAQISGLSNVFVNLIALSSAALISEFIKIRRRSIEPMRTRVGKGPTMYELMKFKQPNMNDLMKFRQNANLDAESMSNVPTPMSPGMPPMMGPVSPTEVYADLTKWFFIYFLTPLVQNPATRLEDSVIIGFAAGLLAQLVREQKDRELEEQLVSYSRRSQLIASKEAAVADSPMPWQLPPWKPQLRPDFTITRLARSSVECAVQLLTYEASRSYVMAVSPYFKTLGDLQSVSGDFPPLGLL